MTGLSQREFATSPPNKSVKSHEEVRKKVQAGCSKKRGAMAVEVDKISQ